MINNMKEKIAFLRKRFNLHNDILVAKDDKLYYLRQPHNRKQFNSLLEAYIYFRKHDNTKQDRISNR